MKLTYWNTQNEPTFTTLDSVMNEIRNDDMCDGLLYDAPTLDDILDGNERLALDAIVVPNVRLKAKMLAMKRVMNQVSDKIKVNGDPIISEPFMRLGTANIAVLFPLTDDQAITIYFHNPDVNPKQITGTDMLISFKWLLNKKDITIVVAPEKGRDIDVRQVAMRIMKLAEKNMAAFERQNAKTAERRANIAKLTAERDEKKALLAEKAKKLEELEAIKAQMDTDKALAEQEQQKAIAKAETDPTTPQGYAKVFGDEQALYEHQDELDDFFQRRLISLRNLLREKDWDGVAGYPILYKKDFTFEFKTRDIGTGKNTVGITYFVKENETETLFTYQDMLTETIQEIAEKIEQALPKEPVIPEVSIEVGDCFKKTDSRGEVSYYKIVDFDYERFMYFDEFGQKGSMSRDGLNEGVYNGGIERISADKYEEMRSLNEYKVISEYENENNECVIKVFKNDKGKYIIHRKREPEDYIENYSPFAPRGLHLKSENEVLSVFEGYREEYKTLILRKGIDFIAMLSPKKQDIGTVNTPTNSAEEPIVLTGKEFGEFDTSTEEGKKALREKAFEYLTGLAKNKETVFCSALNANVAFTKSGARKFKYFSGNPLKSQMMANIKQIIAKGEKFKESKESYDKNERLTYHYLKTPVHIDDKEYGARVVIRQDGQGNYHYDLQVIDDIEMIIDSVGQKNGDKPNEVNKAPVSYHHQGFPLVGENNTPLLDDIQADNVKKAVNYVNTLKENFDQVFDNIFDNVEMQNGDSAIPSSISASIGGKLSPSTGQSDLQGNHTPIFDDVQQQKLKNAVDYVNTLDENLQLDATDLAEATLKNTLEVLQNNLPINVREGNMDQAKLESEYIASIKEALHKLGSPILDSTSGDGYVLNLFVFDKDGNLIPDDDEIVKGEPQDPPQEQEPMQPTETETNNEDIQFLQDVIDGKTDVMADGFDEHFSTVVARLGEEHEKSKQAIETYLSVLSKLEING